MAITTTQKIIKIGSSKGGIYPAKALKELGVDVGDEVEIVIRKKTSLATDKAVVDAAKSILTQYAQAFKNLANR